MSDPESQVGLLYTKLHPPPVRPREVARKRLMRKLDAAVNQKLTLVCAPAGYGKTTLLSQWTHQHPGPVGWVSLDRSDNDPAQFLRYILAALQQIDPAVGALIPGMLQPPQPLSSMHAWVTLINDVAASEKEFILVLDDYQEVDARGVHEALETLVEHLPDNFHLVLSTRANPPINLPQLRARGQLLELRAADLCFNSEEARLFLREVVGLGLAEEEVSALVEKAEGWPAGLQVAAIVLQDQADLPQAVQTFTGSHRHILDYLATEVIERLPGAIQDFLYQTAILDRLEGSLCDALTGRTDGQQILERLDRENLFTLPLDGHRRWYRYHRLMAEALRRRTEGMSREQLETLHRRASAWYEAQEMIEAAIGHAFEGHDYGRAAGLIEGSAEAILKRSQVVTLLEWLGRLPEELERQRPRLNLIHAWALLLSGGSIRAVRERLETFAGQAGDTPASGEDVVILALIATLTGDVQQGLDYSRQALDKLPMDRTFLRSIAAGNIGMAYVFLGDSDSAIQAFKESIALAQEAGNIMFAVASLSNLGGLYLLQGHLKLAEAVYRQALELSTTKYGQRLPVACRALMGLGEIAREWNHLEPAQALLEEAVRLARRYSETGELVMDLSLARVLQAQGDMERALDLVQKAQGIAIQSTGSTIDDRLVDAALARLWLMQGNLTGAAEWAAGKGFEQVKPSSALPGDQASAVPYDLRAGEWLLYARLQLAQNRAAAALRTLTALLAEAQKQGRARRYHEILVLMAIAYQEEGSKNLAMDYLEESLKQAAPEGYTRVYIEEGAPMVRLLREAVRRGIRKSYCIRLLGAFQEQGQMQGGVVGDPRAGLAEPLSERELEVLRLLAEGCPNREISERLYISLSTVKGHVSSINGKLLARNRTQAVTRARQLGILPDK